MPYIEAREKFQPILDEVAELFTEHNLGCGDMNYLITSLLVRYLKGKSGEELLRYSKINDVIGILECAKLELYRRVAVPYERIKIAANGDVYNV